MSTWIFEAGFALVLFVALLPLALVPLVYLHYRRHGRFAGWPAMVTVITYLYICGLIAFTFFPLPDADVGFCSIREEISYWQLTPFSSIGDILDQVAVAGLASTLTSGVFLQVAFNVLLLVPLGMLLAYRYRRGLGAAVAIGLGVSFAIELTQGTGVWGLYDCPYRLADVDDLLTNTAGAGLGWAIGRALTPILPDPDPAPSPDLDRPTVPRRMAAGFLDLVLLVVVGFAAQIPLVLLAESALGEDFADATWFEPAAVLVGTVLVGIVLFLLVPLLRRDRATPGQVATWLAEAAGTSGDGRIDPARRPQAALRFGVRWAPVLIASLVGAAPPALALVAAAEMVTLIVRSDRRSLSNAASKTTTVTARSLRAARSAT